MSASEMRGSTSGRSGTGTNFVSIVFCSKVRVSSTSKSRSCSRNSAAL